MRIQDIDRPGSSSLRRIWIEETNSLRHTEVISQTGSSSGTGSRGKCVPASAAVSRSRTSQARNRTTCRLACAAAASTSSMVRPCWVTSTEVCTSSTGTGTGPRMSKDRREIAITSPLVPAGRHDVRRSPSASAETIVELQI